MLMKKKLSPKTIMGTIMVPEKPTDLYTIYGTADGVKTGTSQYGDWSSLTGRFEAVRCDNGEQYTSSVCFLPAPLHDLVCDAVKKGDGAVEFACVVSVAPNESVIGYEYFAEPLVDQSEHDPLSELRTKIANRLVAPKTTTPEQKPEPAPKKLFSKK